MVEVDSRLCLLRHEPKLAALLMTRQAGGMGGSALVQFMPLESDREQFERSVIGEVSDSDMLIRKPGCISVTLQDSNGSTFSVDMFYVQFMSLDGTHHHYIGIREVSERALPALTSPEVEQRNLHRQRPSDEQPTLRGTPPQHTAQSLGAAPGPSTIGLAHALQDDEVSVASSTSSQGSASGPRATKGKSKEVTLLATMLRWNNKATCSHLSACCPFHAGVQDMKRVLGRMARFRCKPVLRVGGNVQCDGCGLFSTVSEPDGSLPFCCDGCKGDTYDVLFSSI